MAVGDGLADETAAHANWSELDVVVNWDGGAPPANERDAALDAAVRREQTLLETLLQSPLAALSWHNPDQSNLLDFQFETIGGLFNAYSGRLRRDYVYCSDSNGYWRFKSMKDVISEGHDRLHLLTHPDWWTPEVMAPSERIDRAILGRARKIRSEYDRRLALGGRLNVGGNGS